MRQRALWIFIYVTLAACGSGANKLQMEPAPSDSPGASPSGSHGASGTGRRDPIRVVGNVQAPKLISRVEPIVPGLARIARLTAPVILEVTVDEDGTVSNARVLRGHPLLNDSALAAVRQWRYEPTLLGDNPIKVSTTVILPFVSLGEPRLDPAVALLIDRVRRRAPPDPQEASFVRGRGGVVGPDHR